MALAPLMVVSIAATAFAASGRPEITGMAEDLSFGYSGDSYLGDISPQDERVEYIDLTDAMFTWDEEIEHDDQEEVATPTSLTSSQIRDARLTVRATNSKVLENVSIDTSKSRIEIDFADELVGTKEIDFDFDVVLSIDGRRQNDYAISFSGTFGNPVYEVYGGAESEDISGGEVAEAQEYVKAIKLDVGAGVTINTRMMDNSRIYATATRTPDKADENVFEEYKEIQDVINLKMEGVPTSATVTLGAEYGDYFVYCSKGNYLGRGDDDLKLVDKYYLSSKMAVDYVNDNSPDKDKDNDEPTQPSTEPSSTPTGSGNASVTAPTTPPNVNNIPGTGGLSGMAPPNANNNPGTGR
jgi:hypothetical protein